MTSFHAADAASLRGRGRSWLVRGLAVLVLAAVPTCMVMVDETEFVIVERLGRIVQVYDRPADRGLHFKLPWPVESTRRFDRRLQLASPPGREVFTRDRKNIVVESYIGWKIAESAEDAPLQDRPVVQFFRSLGTADVATLRLGSRLQSIVTTQLGQVDLADLLSATDSEAGPGEGEGPLAQLSAHVKAELQQRPEESRPLQEQWGLEVVDVRIRRLNLPAGNQQAVFERMKSERQKIAERYRSAGLAESRMIRSQADRQAGELLAQGAVGRREDSRGGRSRRLADSECGPRGRPRVCSAAAEPGNDEAGAGGEHDAGSVGLQSAPETADGGSACGRASDGGEASAGSPTVTWFQRLCGLVVAGWLVSGTFVVPADEKAVVRRFGRMLPEPRASGLHWDLPWPLARVDRVNVTAARTLILGAEAAVSADRLPEILEKRPAFLTGDKNLLHVRIAVQFRLAEDQLADYLYRQSQPEARLRLLVEAAVADLVGRSGVDFVQTAGLSALNSRLLVDVRRRVADERLGLDIDQVTIDGVEPPLRVKADFLDVSNARADMSKMISDARTQGEQALAVARADARQALDQAEQDRQGRVTASRGAADRFVQLVRQIQEDAQRGPLPYAESRRLALGRFHADAVRQILSQIRSKLVLDGSAPVDLALPRASAP